MEAHTSAHLRFEREAPLSLRKVNSVAVVLIDAMVGLEGQLMKIMRYH